MLYLVEKYDTEKRLTATDEKGKVELLQWLFFQVSGQGYVPRPISGILMTDLPISCLYFSPYFGQAVWFELYHPEKLPSAIERYKAEIRRVFGVLETVLSKQEWLAAGKMTIADLAFVT